MAKYDLVFFCGHKSSVILYGKESYQREQLKYLSHCLCYKCKMKNSSPVNNKSSASAERLTY